MLGTFADRRDWNAFGEAYGDPRSGCALPEQFLSHWSPVVRGPITYTGHEALQRDIANLKAGLEAAGVEEGWMNSVAPASCSRFANEHYATDEELLYACADAMHEEYKAIIDAGLILQLDDPAIAENWDQTASEPSVEAYQRYTKTRIDALNHAIRGLPADRIRFHLCWGSWHGPHVTDIPMADIVDLMLEVNANAYSFEAANVRHEHEWRVWHDVKLPDEKVLLPGVVSHATNVVEHPERGRGPDRALSPRRSGASVSSRQPTAGSAAGSIRRSRGPSSKRLRRARSWRASASGDRVGACADPPDGACAVRGPGACTRSYAARSCVTGSSARPTWHESQSGAPIS